MDDNKPRDVQIKECNKVKEDCVKGFNDVMTFIINALHSVNKSDDDIITIRDSYLTAKTESPDCIILQAGPYVWKYREEISSENINSLLKNEYNNEITTVQQTLPDASKMDQIQILLAKVKRSWHLITPMEQTTLKKKFKDLLKQYATYSMVDKKLESLSVKH